MVSRFTPWVQPERRFPLAKNTDSIPVIDLILVDSSRRIPHDLSDTLEILRHR